MLFNVVACFLEYSYPYCIRISPTVSYGIVYLVTIVRSCCYNSIITYKTASFFGTIEEPQQYHAATFQDLRRNNDGHVAGICSLVMADHALSFQEFNPYLHLP